MIKMWNVRLRKKIDSNDYPKKKTNFVGYLKKGINWLGSKILKAWQKKVKSLKERELLVALMHKII